MTDAFINVVEPGSDEADLLEQIRPASLPRHVAVIMDGNGRWARMRGKPRAFGHQAGVESVRQLLDTSARLRIQVLTLYAFSTENWKRPRSEVAALMSMLKRQIRRELPELHANNIVFRAIGDLAGLSSSVQKELARAEELTAANTGTVLNVALNYGGRAEILQAARRTMRTMIAKGASPDDLTERDLEQNLWTAGSPDVDLLIRTSGEMRISNFLLWQIAYSELYFTPTLFPDFRRAQFFEALIEFQERNRRFGSLEAAQS